MTTETRDRLGLLVGPALIAWTLLQLMCVASEVSPAPKPVKPGHPDPSKFTVRTSPRMNLAPAATLLIVAEVKDMAEAEYCPGVRIEFGHGQASENVQDCPPYAEYLQMRADWDVCVGKVRTWDECRQQVCVAPAGFSCTPSCAAPPKECIQPPDITTSWSWRPIQFKVGYGGGQHALRVVFYLPNDKTVEKSAEFFVAGE